MLLILLSALMAVPYRPALAAPGAAQDVTLSYHIDRSALPQLTYNDLTLVIHVGSAQSVTATADGAPLPVRYDPSTGEAVVTTSGTNLVLTLSQAAPGCGVGGYTKAALKDDKAFAWSHSFDDNVFFKQYGIPAFQQVGWRASVYVIGKDLAWSRNENWLIDRPDLISLAQQGWGIGNHTWSHVTVAQAGDLNAATQDVITLANYLRQAMDDAGLPNYRLMSFAAPEFDKTFQPMIDEMRATGSTQLLFNEAGERGFMRVDSTVDRATYSPYDSIALFDPYQPVGRDWRVQDLGLNNYWDQSFYADFDRMITSLGPNNHYWLNTFTHDVDRNYPNQGIFVMIPWIYNTYGPGGNHSVWVAPAEEIYSYLLVRDGVSIQLTRSAMGICGTSIRTFLPSVTK